MDNDESIFSSPKSIIGHLFLAGITLYIIYWIYINLIKDEQRNENRNNNNYVHNNAHNRNQNQNSDRNRRIKQKLSINMSLLMKDSKKSILEDIKILYDLFD